MEFTNQTSIAVWLTSVFSGLVLFFIYRLVKKSEGYHDLEKKFELSQQSLSAEIRTIHREMDRSNMDAKSLAEIHQYFGQIKQTQDAFFKRIDELRSDFRTYKVSSQKDIDDIRKGYYEVKAKILSQ